MSAPLKSPKKLIEELGIIEPSEIDIEAIAQYCSATVLYEPLRGCEARIVGNQERAIITVNAKSSRTRQRFSAAHELGHWMQDRNRIGFSCTEDAFISEWRSDNPERLANRFAADLLLPPHMFQMYARNLPLVFDSVRSLASVFETSLTATAIRLVELGSYPGMIIYLVEGHRRWFISGPDIPPALWPRESPKRASIAWELANDIRADLGPTDVQADSWLEHPRSQWYELVEDSVPISRSAVLTLLWWKNEKQLLDLTRDGDE